MKDPLGVNPSKRNQGTTRGKEKILLPSVGIEPTTSGLDLPLLCRLSYEVGQRKSETIECDWHIELSDYKLSDNTLGSELVKDRTFLNQS